MLVIRSEQLRVLADARREAFLRDLEGHVRRYFPAVAEARPAPALREALRAAIGRAEAFGLETPADLCVYVNLCAVLGWELEALPEHAWVDERLRDGSIPSVSQRLRLAADEVGQRLAREEQRRVAEQRFMAGAPA